MKKYLYLAIVSYSVNMQAAEMIPGLDTRASKPVAHHAAGDTQRSYLVRTFYPKTRSDLDERETLIILMGSAALGAVTAGRSLGPVAAGSSAVAPAVIAMKDRARWEPLIGILEKNEQMRKDLALQTKAVARETAIERMRVLSQSHRTPISASSTFEIGQKGISGASSHSEAWTGPSKSYEAQKGKGTGSILS